MCFLRIHQSNGHQWRLGHEEDTGERQQIQFARRLHQPPQQARKEWLESLHNGSKRLPPYKSVSNQTGNTWSEKQEHEGSYPEEDSLRNPPSPCLIWSSSSFSLHWIPRSIGHSNLALVCRLFGCATCTSNHVNIQIQASSQAPGVLPTGLFTDCIAGRCSWDVVRLCTVRSEGGGERMRVCM